MSNDLKPWYRSKTKQGLILIAAGPILVTVGSIFTGSTDFVSGIQALVVQAGLLLGAFGIRDLPFINRVK